MNKINLTGTDLSRPNITRRGVSRNALTFTFIPAIIFAVLLTLFGCSGDADTIALPNPNNPNGNALEGNCVLKQSDDGNYEIFCDGEPIGFLSPGEKGETGEKGDTGQDGTSCTIEAEENSALGDWKILCGGVHVGYLNNGDKGEQGEKGEKGEQGEKGEKGNTGEDGQSCDLAEDGAYFVMSCGDVEKARWAKAMCGSTAYDPKAEYICIGTRLWMKRNLDVVPTGANGAATNSWCNGDEPFTGTSAEDDNCETYGRLYDWATAMALDAKCNTTLSTSDPDCAIDPDGKHQGICPDGFHIPSSADWEELFASVGGISTAQKLKSTAGWSACGPVGSGKTYICEDAYGFSALPGGYRNPSNGFFGGAGYSGFWWSASEYDSGNARISAMDFSNESIARSYDDKTYGYSVRCVGD